MFEPGTDQAAGLRAGVHRHGPVVMPVASPAQPARAYELLCQLAMSLRAAGRLPVIVDGTAAEAAPRHGHDGSHLGLQHALTDPSISGLGHAGDGHEWLVMPAAQGLHTLRQTALAAGGAVALSRLLSPFDPGTVLLMFALPHALAPLLNGLNARVMVPVLAQPQAGIDAYGAVKLLHLAGLSPVLAPMLTSTAELPLEPVVASVCDCAERHLGLTLERWAEPVWATAVQEHAQRRPQRMDVFHGLRDPRFVGSGTGLSAVPSLWS
jgi:hypothetical protein